MGRRGRQATEAPEGWFNDPWASSADGAVDRRRVPVSQLRWCGGGARCSFAEQLIEKASRNARTSGVRTRTDHILPMPSLVPAELSQWLLDRQSRSPRHNRIGWSARSGVTGHIHVVRQGSAYDGDERRNGSLTTRSGNWSGAVFGDKQCELRPTYGLHGVRGVAPGFRSGNA